MTANEVFTTEIIEETLKVQWKIRNFRDIHSHQACRDTLNIQVDTGKSSKLETKWIIGFASTDTAPEPAPVPLSQRSASNTKRIEPLIYCKLVEMPNEVKKVWAKLCVTDNKLISMYSGWGPPTGSAFTDIARVNRSLTLNQQMEARYYDNLQNKMDEEGSLVLNIELKVVMSLSLKSKPPQCLPD